MARTVVVALGVAPSPLDRWDQLVQQFRLSHSS
jgi:hypothetical protein